MLSQGNCAMPL